MPLTLVTVVAALLVLLPALGAAPPNVVLIIADDQAWTDFGFMGHGAIHTPHPDRLASEGAVFHQGLDSGPRPGRAGGSDRSAD